MIDDKRNFMYIHCCRALLQAQPKVFIAENVKGLLTLGKGEAYRQIKADFAAAGYNIYAKLLDSRDYGVPQTRERVVMVGVRKDLDFVYNFPEPTHGEGLGLKPFATLRRAIWDLRENPGWGYEGTASSQFMGRNRKKNWNQYSYTIQASARQSPVHPEGDPMIKIDSQHWKFANDGKSERRISVKEAARIQTFPDWFKFNYGTEDVARSTKIDKLYKQIGNAVPVLMAKVISKPIVKFLNQLKEIEQDNTLVTSNEVSEQAYNFPVSAISTLENEATTLQNCEPVRGDEVLIVENTESLVIKKTASTNSDGQLSIDDLLTCENEKSSVTKEVSTIIKVKQDVSEELPLTENDKKDIIKDVHSFEGNKLDIIEEETSIHNQKQLSFNIFM